MITNATYDSIDNKSFLSDINKSSNSFPSFFPENSLVRYEINMKNATGIVIIRRQSPICSGPLIAYVEYTRITAAAVIIIA